MSRMDTVRDAVRGDVPREIGEVGGGMPRIEDTGAGATEFAPDARSESEAVRLGAGNALILVNARLVFSMPRDAKRGGRVLEGLRSDDVSDASVLAGLCNPDGVRKVDVRRLRLAFAPGRLPSMLPKPRAKRDARPASLAPLGSSGIASASSCSQSSSPS